MAAGYTEKSVDSVVLNLEKIAGIQVRSTGPES
jgi:hypothetical protein